MMRSIPCLYIHRLLEEWTMAKGGKFARRQRSAGFPHSRFHRITGTLILSVITLLGTYGYGQQQLHSSIDPVAVAASKLQIPGGLLSQPKAYTCYYTNDTIKIDGQLTEKAWKNAAYSDKFGDILGASVIKGIRKDRPEDILPTQVKMCWNNEYLFIAARLNEPHIRAVLKQRDTIVFHDNDFEVFIDPANNTRNYFEFEVNALNTLLDLFMPKPYSYGGNAMITWDAKGIRHKVSLQGSINKDDDQDSSWTVEMAIPFTSLQSWGRSVTPKEGALWRINFSRVQWDYVQQRNTYSKKLAPNGRVAPEHNWTWSPQGVSNMHLPEKWGYLFFAEKRDYKPILPVIELQKQLLWQVSYLQKAFFKKNRTYALTLDALGLKENRVSRNWHGKRIVSELNLEATKSQYIITLKDTQDHHLLTIDQLGNIRVDYLN